MVQSRNRFFLFFLPVSIRSLLYSLSGKELIQSQRCYQNFWKDVNSGIWSCWVSKLIILSQFRVSESGIRKPLLRCLKLGCPTVPLAGDWP